MRTPRLLTALLAAACLFAVAIADDALHLELKNGSKFDGRIVSADDASIAFRTSSGGDIRIAWKDLDAASWLAAKKLVVDPKDGRALLALAQFAADNSLRAEAESLADRAGRADASLAGDVAKLAP